MIFKILPTKNYKSWPHSFNGPNFTFCFSRLSEVLIEKKWELICRNLSQFKNNIIYLKLLNFKCEITIWGWDHNKKQDLISVKQEQEISSTFWSTKTVQVRLPFHVMQRCVQYRNRTLYGLISHTLNFTHSLSVLRLMQLSQMAPPVLTCFHLVSAGPLRTAEAVFLPYVIKCRTQNVKRIDLVWDCYLENSLKQRSREARDTGTRRHVWGTDWDFVIS